MKQLQEKHDVDSRLVIKPNRFDEIILIATIIFIALIAIVEIRTPGFALNFSGGWEYTLLVIAVIAVLYVLYRIVRALLKPGIYVFDHSSQTFSVDGESLGRLSDIREVTVTRETNRRGRRYTVNIVRKSGASDMVGTYILKNSAILTAERISSFLGVPETND